jgi:hypothetical protein
MIHPNLQETLFTTPKSEAIEYSGVKELIISQWYDLNYLSFDILKVNELTEPQFIELTFISKLMSNIDSKSMLNYLLSKLQKPYAYRFDKVFFNVFNNEWEYTDKKIEDFSDQELMDIVIENANDDKELLEVYIIQLEAEMHRLKENRL